MGIPKGQLLADNAEYDLSKDVMPLRKIPIVNRIPASGSILGFDESPTTEWTYTDNLTEPGLFALRVHGDSMADRIEDGDLVIVAPNREYENNRVYAIVINGDEHTLKLVRRTKDGYLLIPYNRAFDPITVETKDVLRMYRVINVVKVL
jgi:repressor LexA